MKLVICLDVKNGMLFAGKRQSRDRAVCEKILDLSAGSTLWMNDYSATLFDVSLQNIKTDSSFLELAGRDDFCFAENVDITKCLPQVDTLIVFRWNRHYPANVFFSEFQHMNKVKTEDFPGNSHEKITMEVYKQ